MRNIAISSRFAWPDERISVRFWRSQRCSSGKNATIGIYGFSSDLQLAPKWWISFFLRKREGQEKKKTSSRLHLHNLTVRQDISKSGISSSGLYEVASSLRRTFQSPNSAQKWSKIVLALKNQYLLNPLCTLPDFFTTWLAVKLLSLPNCFWHSVFIDSEEWWQFEWSFWSTISQKIAHFTHFLHIFFTISWQLSSRLWLLKKVNHC